MATYLVTWTIDIEANSPTQAAIDALKIQRRPGGTAVVFEVKKHGSDKSTTIDLIKNFDLTA